MSESNEAVIERIRKLMAYAKDDSARIRDEAYDTGREDGSRASIETNGLSSSGTPAPKKLS